MNLRPILRKLIPLLAVLALASPAVAQDMGDNGFTLPAFLFSRGEQLARATCINELPNCRPDVRTQIELERAISLFLPWGLLVAALVVLLGFFRRKEQAKAAHRRMAQRKHSAGAFRKLNQEADDAERRDAEDARNADDRFN